MSAATRSAPNKMTIELLHTPGCAHIDDARSMLNGCLAEIGLVVNVVEREGAYPSPTILINGRDVMGRELIAGAMCRLDLPTRDNVLKALTP
jgi:hypothetical protein